VKRSERLLAAAPPRIEIRGHQRFSLSSGNKCRRLLCDRAQPSRCSAAAEPDKRFDRPLLQAYSKSVAAQP